MARIKGATMTRKRRNKVLKLSKGYYGSNSKTGSNEIRSVCLHRPQAEKA